MATLPLQDSLPGDRSWASFGATRRIGGHLIFTLSATAAYLYVRLFTLRCTPILLGGDQVYFWMDGMRLMHGEHIYRDFFRYTPPGTDLLFAALFKLLAPQIWVTNLVVFLLGLAFAWMCFSIAGKLMGAPQASLATGLYMVLVYGVAVNATNHWFAVLAIAGALNVMMSGDDRLRLGMAGALLAVAAFFNQAHAAAALLGMCLFLLWRRRAQVSFLERIWDLGALFLGAGAAFLLLNAYFIATVGWKQLWYCEVTYVLKYSIHRADGWSLGLRGGLTWMGLPRLAAELAIYALLPAVYSYTLWLCWSRRREKSVLWDRVALLSVVGCLLAAEVAVAINWLRLFAVSLPGVILVVWLFAERLRMKRYIVALAWVMLFGICVRQVVATRAVNRVVASFPGGTFATARQSYEKLQWTAQRTAPGDFFLQAGWPGVYLPLQLRNPLYVATVDTYDAPRAEDIAGAVQEVKARQVRYVLWTRYLDRRCKPGSLCNDSVSPLRNYVHASYWCAHTFSDGDTLWERDDLSGSGNR